jgi:integrase
MAANGSVHKIGSTYHVLFRYGGKQFSKTLKTGSKKEATDRLGEIRNTLRKLDNGDVTMPVEADPATWIMTGGKVQSVAVVGSKITFGEVCQGYLDSWPDKAKAGSSIRTETIHIGHFKKFFKESSEFRVIVNADRAQAYVNHRAKSVIGDTIDREIGTLRLIWAYAHHQLNIVPEAHPFKAVNIPVTDDKPDFMTMADIEKKIGRGGLTKKQEAAVWECLFLTIPEVREFLTYSEKTCVDRQLPAWLHPLVCAAGMTGARRSELMRSEIDDWNLETNKVQIREMKKKKKMTFRHIEITPELSKIMKAWFAQHPGGQMAFTENREALRLDSATHFFQKLRAGSKWENVAGYHVFRHSFASNLAAGGIAQAVIDSYMGHIGEAAKRYRHLLPSEKKSVLTTLFTA